MRGVKVTASEKVRENKLRRMAARRGLVLLKSRRRDPGAIDYGGWMVADAGTGGVVTGADPAPYFLSIDEVEAFLGEWAAGRRKPAPSGRGHG